MKCFCGQPALARCAWIMPKYLRFLESDSSRCERPVCAVHAKQVAKPGEEAKFLCPEHQLRYDDWKRKHNKQGNLFEEAA